MSSKHNQHNQSELNEFAASSRHDAVKVAVEENGRCWIIALDDVAAPAQSRIMSIGDRDSGPEIRATEDKSTRVPGTFRAEGDGPLPDDVEDLRGALHEFVKVTEKIEYDGPVSVVFRRDFDSVENFVNQMKEIVDKIDHTDDE